MTGSTSRPYGARSCRARCSSCGVVRRRAGRTAAAAHEGGGGRRALRGGGAAARPHHAVERPSRASRSSASTASTATCSASPEAGDEVEVQVASRSRGRVVGTESFGFSDVRIDDGDVMSSFLGQYYGDDSRAAPREILCSAVVRRRGCPRELALGSLGSARISDPSAAARGLRAQLVGMASEQRGPVAANAARGAGQRRGGARRRCRRSCSLSRLPRRIECYDVSNLQGDTLPVASRVVFEDGLRSSATTATTASSRRWGATTTRALREVIRRRLRPKVESEPLPDLLMVDGGRGQLGVLSACLRRRRESR